VTEHRNQSPMTLEAAWLRWYGLARAGTVRKRGGKLFKGSTLDAYARAMNLRVLPVFGDLDLGEITRPMLIEFVYDLAEEGLSEQTIHLAIASLRPVYKWAINLDKVKHNPTSGVELPKPESRQWEVLDRDQVEQYLATVSDKDRPVWTLAFFGGLRRGEMAALAWSDVDFAAGLLHVRQGWDAQRGAQEPKSKKSERRLPLFTPVRHQLARVQAAHDGISRYVFGHDAVRNAGRNGQLAMLDSGLREVTFHDARHNFASLMIDAAVNVRDLSEWMGHHSVAFTLDTYGHLMPTAAADAIERVDAYLEG
jgi:integrase